MKPLLAVLVLAACVDQRSPITGTQSLKIDLVAPSDPGSPDKTLPDTARAVTVNVTALDVDGNVDTSFDRDVYVYSQFLGTLTPALNTTPLTQFKVSAGKATNQTVTLPDVFGPTTIWIDDGKNAAPTFATGTSPTLWFRAPFIQDIQKPTSETAIDALIVSPLENKTISVSGSRYGATGRLVVTSVFSQGYTVADVNCADATGKPPCVAGPYDHIEVFSFSAPGVDEGQTIDGFTGGISDFNGLTELGFPQTFYTGHDVNMAREPAPAKFDPAWFNALSDPMGMINFERNEAGPIEIDNAVVCNLDSDFDTYKQWKIDPSGVGGDCKGMRTNVLNVITAGTISDLDPTTLVGKKLPKVVGVLRPVNGGSFNVWIIYPRSHADLVLQ